jgi:hypothetical protein
MSTSSCVQRSRPERRLLASILVQQTLKGLLSRQILIPKEKRVRISLSTRQPACQYVAGTPCTVLCAAWRARFHQSLVPNHRVTNVRFANDVGPSIGLPRAATQKRLLPARTEIAAAASARIHPVLRRSSPRNPSRSRPAFTAERCCTKNRRS